MRVSVFDIDKFTQANLLNPVTDPITLENGNIPTINGLLSLNIFGRSQQDRRETFAYIDLKGIKCIHPLVYISLVKLNRKIEELVAGTSLFVFNPNTKNIEKTEDDTVGRNGINFLYEIIDDIDFSKNGDMISNSRKENIDFIKSLNKDEIFCTRFIICPPFYRDVNLQNEGATNLGDINRLYILLLKLVNNVSKDDWLDFVGTATIYKIQKTLVEIYNYFATTIKGKDGFFRQSVLGKSVEYGSRLVISTDTFEYDSPEAMNVNYYTTGIPLHMCCSEFTPFILYWLKNFFTNEFMMSEKYPIINDKNEIEYVTLKNPMQFFNDKFIKSNLDRFVHSANVRYDKIPIPVYGNEPKYMVFKGRYYKENTYDPESPLVERYATWTDLLYMACVDVVADKHVLVTRYPILDQFSIFPNRIFILTTYKTRPMFISDRIYKNYPDIDLKNGNPSDDFYNTLIMSNIYLKGLGADFDGDQVSVRGLFTQEANVEAEKFLTSKNNILTINGGSVKEISNEAIQSLYNLTKD